MMLYYFYTDCVDINKLKNEDVFGAYWYLLNTIENFFKEIEFTEVKSACTLRGYPLSQEFKQKIDEAENLNDILNIFNNTTCCNFLNVELLKVIVSKFHNQEIEKAIDTYENHVYSSKISSVTKHYIKWRNIEESLSLIEVEINCNHEDSTVGQIVKCCGGLKELMKLYPGAISAIGSRPGCLRITVVIPLHCSLHAFEMAKKNFIMLRQYHIQYLEFESFSTKVFAFNCCNDENALTILSSNPKCEFHALFHHAWMRVNYW